VRVVAARVVLPAHSTQLPGRCIARIVDDTSPQHGSDHSVPRLATAIAGASIDQGNTGNRVPERLRRLVNDIRINQAFPLRARRVPSMGSAA
jgi:hypothetical protein